MKITRKEFLKISGATAAAGAGGLGTLLSGCKSGKDKEVYTRKKIRCPFCAVGCGLTAYLKDNSIVKISGNKNDPVSRGYFCAKANAILDVDKSKKSLTKIKYRAPYSNKWTEISMQQACKIAAERIQKSRDESFIHKKEGTVINRTEAIGALAGENLTNEELFSFVKFLKILGITDVGSDVLIKSGAKNKVLQNLLGYGAEPNPVYDIENSDVIVIFGADPAEDSPVYCKYLNEAKKRGAKIIQIDFQYGKTSLMADIFAQIKPETDIYLLNGIINYILKNKLYDKEYLQKYTDAGNLINDDFLYDFENNIFSGFNKNTNEYDNTFSWNYAFDKRGNAENDTELRDKNCILLKLKEISSNYDADYIKNSCGMNTDDFLQILEIIGNSSKNSKRLSFILGNGVLSQFQSSQIMHAISIIQLLLGNIGLPGGGIFSIEKYNNYQSLNDFIPDWNELPGGINLPIFSDIRKDLKFDVYNHNNSILINDPVSYNYYKDYAKYSIPLLKSIYGEKNDVKYSYNWMPKIDKFFNTESFFQKIIQKKYTGLFLFNSCVLENPGLLQMFENNYEQDWIIGSSCVDSEFYNFWKNNPEKNKTEILLFPSLFLHEKEGTFTDISRKIEKINPIFSNRDIVPLNSILEKIIFDLKKLYKPGAGANPEPVNMSEPNFKSEQLHNDIFGIGKEVSGMHLYSVNNLKDEKIFTKSRSFNGNKYKLNNGNGFTWPGNTVYLYNKIAIEKDIFDYNDEFKNKDKDIINGGADARDKKPFILKNYGIANLIYLDSELAPIPIGFKKENANYKIPVSINALGTKDVLFDIVVINSKDKNLLYISDFILSAFGKDIFTCRNLDCVDVTDSISQKIEKDIMIKFDNIVVVKNTTKFDKKILVKLYKNHINLKHF